MDPLTQAVKDFSKNITLVLAYSVGTGFIVLLYRLANEYLHTYFAGESSPWLSMASLALSLYLAVGAAAIQTVAFSFIAVRLDYPLWKCTGVQEAIRRFFMVWFTLNLLLVLFTSLLVSMAEREWVDAMAWAEFCTFFLFVLTIPLGACIMFWGEFDSTQLGEIFKPLYKRFSWTLWVLSLGFLQWILMMARGDMLEEKGLEAIFVLSITDIPLSCIDCLIFIMMWRICMELRNRGFEEEEDPYE